MGAYRCMVHTIDQFKQEMKLLAAFYRMIVSKARVENKRTRMVVKQYPILDTIEKLNLLGLANSLIHVIVFSWMAPPKLILEKLNDTI